MRSEAFEGWLEQQRSSGRFRLERGQRADWRERHGFIAWLYLALVGSGLRVTADPGGALADVARTLGRWAGVEVPTSADNLKRLLAGVRRAAGITVGAGRRPGVKRPR